MEGSREVTREISQNATDMAKRLDDDEMTRFNLGGKSGETNFVNENGLYSVILRSDKPSAKKFRKWIASEVLSTIRKVSGYVNNDDFTSVGKPTIVQDNPCQYDNIPSLGICSKKCNCT